MTYLLNSQSLLNNPFLSHINMTEIKDAHTIVRARVVHFKDALGKIQAIFPQESMLDVSVITRLSKRRLDPVLPSEYPQSSQSLLKNCVTYIDNALKYKEHIIIELTNKAPEVIQGDDLQDLFEDSNSQFSNIAIPLTDIPTEIDDHLNDEGQMLEALGRFQSIHVRQKLEQTLELPPLPVSSQRILHLCTKKYTGTDELCKIINLDPSLSAQVVSWASSPFYGAPGEIQSVEDAIIRVLGFDMVMNLALGLSMGKVLENPTNGPKHYNDYWFNAVHYASLMYAITEKMPPDIRPRLGHAYLTGLLHNFGYLAINTVLPSHFVILARYLEANTHLQASIVEMQLLRLTSEQMGTWLLRHWSLPESICDGIRYSKKSQHFSKGGIIATMLNVCHKLINGTPIPKGSLKILCVSQEELDAILAHINDTSDSLKRMAAIINR